MNDEREAFEAASYAYYLERHAAGKTADCHEPAGTREALLWRKEDGTYGVLLFNASWWAWQTARAQARAAIRALLINGEVSWGLDGNVMDLLKGEL